MRPDHRYLEKLDKVLALTDSPHDGEALAALRAARRLLRQPPLGLAVPDPELDELVAQLETEARQLRRDLAGREIQQQEMLACVRHWQERAERAEQALARARHDLQHWQQLARDTARQLWDVGQLLLQEQGRRRARRSRRAGDLANQQ